MRLNKQSNIYTILYIVILVVVVGTALAVTSMSLKDRQQANADAAKMKQILAAARITVAEGESVSEIFNRYIVEQPVYDAQGKRIDGSIAFDVDVQKQAQEAAEERLLPVYVAKLQDGATKYIVPVYGNGLWGPIWGYVAFNDDKAATIYGAFFDHQGETPGLGAEIAKPEFCDQFRGKSPYNADGKFLGIAVVKKGMKPNGDEEYVDGISGGTITSKGVDAMLSNCLKPYEPILNRLTNGTDGKNYVEPENSADKATSDEGRQNG